MPITVIASDPAPATSTITTGVQERHFSASTIITAAATIGVMIGPPKVVNRVISWFRSGVRCAIIQSSIGWSNRASPLCRITAS